MKYKVIPPKEFLLECFEYIETGHLIWKTRPLFHFKSEKAWKSFNSNWSGKLAGHIDDSCYWKVGLLYESVKNDFYLHRIIWVIHNGPIGADLVIDHRDVNTLNNKISNLRECTSGQNNHNSPLDISSSSRIKGVNWHSASSKWRARLCFNGTHLHIGSYLTKEEAANAVRIKRNELCKQFANHG